MRAPLSRLMLTLALIPAAAFAADRTVTMHAISADGVGAALGTVTITESRYGLVFTPKLNGLAPGVHGFHVHQNPSCQPGEKNGKMTAGLGAGGHYDPVNTGFHSAPWGAGHLGDLPALYVSDTGEAATPVLAPRLQMSDLDGRALMIHAGGDNYADQPTALGGGGARTACGVVK